jgi:hypothetical protein
MNSRRAKLMPILAAGLMVLAGCATSDVNAPQARAKMGYVDLYDASSGDLSWEVSRFDDRTGQFSHAFYDWHPPKEGILRLAFEPGHHRLSVTYLNRAVIRPADIQLEVEDGRITPVCLSLKQAGSAEVETAETSIGDTLYGTFGRRTKVSSYEEGTYRLMAIAAEPVAYQPKAKMPYAR